MFKTVTVQVIARQEPATDAHGNAVCELGAAEADAALARLGKS